MIANVIRWGLTIVLIYGVFTETGIWTAISLTLLFLGIEVGSYNLRTLIKDVDKLSNN